MRLRSRLASAVFLGLVACGDASSTSGSPSATAPAPDASASSSASLTASASASAPAASASHAPGTLPAAPPPPPPPKGLVSLDPPTLTRLAPSPASRADVKGDATFARDGRLVLGEPGALHLLDAANGDGVTVRTGAAIVTWDLVGSRLAALESTGRLTVWDLVAGSLVRTWQRDAVADGGEVVLSLAADGARVAVAYALAPGAKAIEPTLTVLDVATGAVVLERPAARVFQVALGADGVAYAENNASALLVPLDGGAPRAEHSLDTGGTFGAALSPDARWVSASAPAGHGMHVADLRVAGSLREIVKVEGCDEHVSTAFSGDARFVYAMGGTRWVKGFHTGTWKPYASYHATPGRRVVSFADDLSRVLVARTEAGDAYGLAEPTVIVTSGQKETRLVDVPSGEWSFSMAGDGKRVLASLEGRVIVWGQDGRVTYRVGAP